METLEAALKRTIRDVPDFPKPGIVFKDITPVLQDAALMRRIVDDLAAASAGAEAVLGMESRGFIFGTPLALQLGVGFVPARKPGKLPYHTVGVDYALEYGTARLEVHTDAIRPGQKVVVVDDLLATGGTAAAAVQLVRELGGEVTACLFVVELGFLDGRAKLDVPVHALVRY